MSTEQQLLAAIWAAPNDDLPRLVYADYLEETGEPAKVARAEFIRVQCELARMDEDDDGRAALEKRERQLHKRHVKDWRAEVPKGLQSREFRRGFCWPRERVMTAKQFLALNKADWENVPLWRLRLEVPIKNVPAVAACDTLTRIGELSLNIDTDTPSARAAFLASPHLTNISALNLSWCHPGTEWVSVLNRYKPFPRLTKLKLSTSDLDSEITALADCTALASVTEFHFSGTGLGDTGLVALANFSRYPRLAHIRLEPYRDYDRTPTFTPAAVQTLSSSGYRKALRVLDFTCCFLGDVGLEALCTRAAFQLTELDLSFNGITDAGVITLAAWPGLATVRHLHLSFNRVARDGTRALIRSPYLSAVRQLSLVGNDFLARPSSRRYRDELVERFGKTVEFRLVDRPLG